MIGIVRSRTLWTAVFVLLVGGAFRGLEAQNDSLSIAVVDLEQVVALSSRGQELQSRLKAFEDEVTTEGTAMMEQARDLRQRIADGANALSEDRLSELQKEYEDATIALRRFQDDKTREGEKIQGQGLQQIESELGPIFEQVQEELGYDLILNQVPGIVLYASEALDITQILIDRFNSGTAVEETPSE